MSVKEALNSMAAYCAAAERCQSDVQKRLEKWELSEEEEQEVIVKLIKENFLSEERYARAYTNDKYKYAKWGKKKIAQGLYLKRVDDRVISEALGNIDYQVYIDNLKSVLTQKAKTVKANSDYEKNGKLVRFALGRGYEYGDISKVLPDVEDMY